MARARLGGRRVGSPDAQAPVTMLELFFDLVFVFTVTQLTALVVHTSNGSGYAQAASVLVVIWWMYDGYCWLSNNVGPTSTSTRLPMLVAMAAFLVLAVTVPEAYGADALLFAVTYLVIVTVHAVSFTRSSLGGSARAILAIAPVNFGAAAVLLVAAFVDERWRWVCWWLAVGVFVYSMAVRREAGFAIRPGHFAERHRLLLIIALGESVIAVGVGGEGRLHEPAVLAVMLLAMVLICLLWWVHFGDEHRAVDRLEELHEQDPTQTVRTALLAFSIGYLVLVAGLILVAAGLHVVVRAPTDRLGWRIAATMAVGVAVYLFGNSFHLWRLGLSAGWVLKSASVLALAVIPLGRLVGGSAETAALALVIAVALTLGKMLRV